MSVMDAFGDAAVLQRPDAASTSANGRGATVNRYTVDNFFRTDRNELTIAEPANSDFELSPAFSGWQSRAKRAFDVIVALVAILGLGPLLLLAALAIVVESRGPVFFRQVREGKNGKPFMAWKFRSMRTDSCDATGVKQTVAGDKRVTKVGKILRKTSIDELPQLFNVLRGDMSLVGPRPHVSGMLAGGMSYRELVPYYDLRLLVTPGLTGWAQANGFRGPTDDAEAARQRIDYDLAYVREFNLLLDIKVIFLTLKREFIGGSGH